MSVSERPRAAVVVTGSELLTGAIGRRTGPFVARELVRLGLEVAPGAFVGARPGYRAGAVGLAGAPAAESRDLRYSGLPESEIAATLRAPDQHGVGVTTCLRRSELEVDIRPQPGYEDVATKLHDELATRHAQQLVSADGTTTD